MGYQFWLKRAIKVYGVVFILLFVVQLLKQNNLSVSLSFAATWAFITTAIFIGSRLYQASKGVECSLCNDIAKPDGKDTDSGA
ncbi:hypothetical protein [Rheinheimera sp. WS51]|uniref:hypothetical protein n=1 Tax=Rheinheimera sp. WS51 TaxID=3425886 RepID=UPI003D8D8166